MTKCVEPDGRERVAELTVPTTRHEAMQALTGACPWCGEEAT